LDRLVGMGMAEVEELGESGRAEVGVGMGVSLRVGVGVIDVPHVRRSVDE
jgi:hypothetical protein